MIIALDEFLPKATHILRCCLAHNVRFRQFYPQLSSLFALQIRPNNVISIEKQGTYYITIERFLKFPLLLVYS